MKERVHRFIAFGRGHFGCDASRRVDWASVEAGLFSRLEDQRRAERARLVTARGRPWAYFGACAIVVAGLATVAGGDGERPAAPSTTADADPIVAKIAEVRGDGRVLLDGALATAGMPVRLGDTLETRGAEATVVREGKLRILIERGSRVSIRQARDPLAIALERGAVQARVAPVAAGEAFAVDVAGDRIAVHGTLLRVARTSAHAAVDLVEGVVSVGRAPRFGSLHGSLVTAPAHVEFSIDDSARTLSVTHDPGSVRPVPISSEPAPAAAPRPRASDRAHRAAAGPGVAPSIPATVPLSRADSPRPPSIPPVAASAETDASGSIRAAVLACMSERPRAENVTVVVDTTLHLEVGDDGSVRTARFDPPVMTGVNECASAAIYKTRFARSGAIDIPVEFRN